MSMQRIVSIATALLLTASVLLPGCSSPASTANPAGAPTGAPATENEPANAPLSGKLNVSGSTSMLELVQELAVQFEDINTGVTVDVQGGGSSVGLQNTLDGISDIGNSSSALNNSDKEKGLTGTDIAMDGVAIVVNTKNGVSGLSKDNIVKIFKGEITNWKDVGGTDHEITVVNREASSGTREAMSKLFGLSGKNAEGKTAEYYTDKAIEQNSTGGVVTTVAGDEYAIGYVSVGSLKETVKALAVDGVKASRETILDGTYKYWRPFVMATKGDAQGLAQAFIDFCIHDPAAIETVNEKYIAIFESK